jgi:hypothetical protein
MIYNASGVNFYNSTGSLARFENYLLRSTLKVAVAGVVAVNLKVDGVAPGYNMYVCTDEKNKI